MSFSLRGSNLPGIVAGVDLSVAQHRFVTIDVTGRAVLSSAGGRIDAVLENDPILNQAASLMGPGSVAKVQAGAAIALGADVASDADGKAVTAVPGDFIIGTCIVDAGAVDELISVWMTSVGGARDLAVFSNATRPAQPVSVGTAIFNTDDNAPNYSDGTNWRDASGALT